MADGDIRSSVSRRLRHRLGPWINGLARAVGQPTTRVFPAGYVGTVDVPVGDLERELREGGFAWDPLSMYHHTREGSSTNGSWVYRSSWFADRQIHVVLFTQGLDRTDVYAHDEFSWLRHPLKHVREVDIRREPAAAEMRRWLDERELGYERRSLTWRKLKHGLQRFRERLTGGSSHVLGASEAEDTSSPLGLDMSTRWSR